MTDDNPSPTTSQPTTNTGKGSELRKQLLKSAAAPLRKHGRFESLLKVTRLRGRSASMAHQVVVPHATYSPWWTDEAFQRTLASVRDHTLVDIYRLYELWHLLGQSREIDGDILEVGVWRGGSGCLLAKKAELDGIDAQIYLCDTFAGVVKAGEHDTEYRGGEHADTSRAAVEALVARMHLRNVHVLEGIFPDDTGADVPSKALRLCHIDVDVYESAQSVFEWAWPRLTTGGVVVFDDYGFYSCEGVTQFVNDLATRSDLLVMQNLNGHAIVIKR